VTQLLPLVDAIPPVAGKVGAPLRKPGLVMGDRAYDSGPHRMALSCRNIATAIARRSEPHGSGLGADRYVAERSLACLHQYRRMRTRFERRDDIHEALMSAAMSMMCWRRFHNAAG
jgi:transposase